MQSKIIERHIPCPSCPSSDAYCIYDDGHGFCFSCNYFKPSKEEINQLDNTYEYLSHRGISQAAFRHYSVKTKVNAEGLPISVGFPYPNGSVKARTTKQKGFYWTGENVPGLFGTDKFASGSHKFVTITEGEYDALSLWEVTRHPVVSVQSSGTARRDCIHDREWLSGFDRIYLAFDNDAAGREALRSVAKLFDFNRLYEVKFTNRKDANDYLQAGEPDELRNIWNNSRRYLPENIVSSFADFKAILEEETPQGVPYPFKRLTEMTYGIHTSESTLITAQEGVGKTEVMHTILHSLLENTDDNVGAIFLEEPKKRLLQSLVGIEVGAPVYLPDHARPPAEDLSSLEGLLKRDERLYVYSHYGCDDPEILLDTIRFLVSARGCRRILLDHITMAVTGLAGEKDERRALDYLSTRLEMMVQELDFSLIVVSHVNDLGQTRGSRYISKLAHTRIDLKRDLAANDNKLFVTVAKNRFGQKTGLAGIYCFDPIKRTYTEWEDGGHISSAA